MAPTDRVAFGVGMGSGFISGWCCYSPEQPSAWHSAVLFLRRFWDWVVCPAYVATFLQRVGWALCAIGWAEFVISLDR